MHIIDEYVGASVDTLMPLVPFCHMAVKTSSKNR